MRARLTKLAAGLAAVSMLAFGGAALAGAANPSANPAPPPAVGQQDTTTPDAPGTPAESSSESASAPETGSEASAPNDGPGGHADGTANASVNYQFQGEQ